jgi:hypothetical protein
MSAIIKTPKDRALLEKWNKKLEKYDDCNIENYNRDEPTLKHWDNFHFKKVSTNEYETRTTYYANARSLLSTGKFRNRIHRKICELHSEGYSLREISTEIKKVYNKDTINKIIKEIIKEQMPK